jgi:hypothetical protein
MASLQEHSGQALIKALTDCCKEVTAGNRSRITFALLSSKFLETIQDIVQLLLAAELEEHYGVSVSAISLANANFEIAQALFEQPRAVLDSLEDALMSAQVGLKASTQLTVYLHIVHIS